VIYTDNPKKDFTILGEVTYDSSVMGVTQKNGFRALLQVAKNQYPDCDYVIDVMIDKQTTIFLFFIFTNFTMRGTAIKYVK
jgi:hypothetical protein